MLRVMSDSLQSHGLLCSRDFQGTNTGVACHFLLQGNFPTQRLNPCFLGGCLGAKSRQSCPSLCNPMDCSPPGSSAHGSLQARILEWIVMSSSGGIFPDPGIESVSPAAPALQVDSLLLRHQGSPSKYMWMCKLLNDFLLCLQRF